MSATRLGRGIFASLVVTLAEGFLVMDGGRVDGMVCNALAKLQVAPGDWQASGAPNPPRFEWAAGCIPAKPIPNFCMEPYAELSRS